MSDIYLSLAETPAVVTLSQPVVSGVLSSTVTVGNTVTVALDANSLSALENVTVTVGAAVSVSNFPASQVVTGSVAVTTMPAISINSVTISSLPALPAGNNQIGKVQILPDLINPIYSVVTNGSGIRIYDSGGQDIVVDGGLQAIQATLVTSVTVGNSVTIGSLPAISGTVTVSNATTASAVAVRLIAEDTNPGGSGAGVNVNLYSNDNALLVDALKNGNSVLGYDGLSSYVQVKPAIGSSVTIGSLPAISGTVTVGNNNFNIKTVIAQDGSANFTAFNGTQFRLYTPTGASKTLNNIFGAIPSWVVAFSDSVTWFSDSGTQVAYFHDGTQWTLDDFTTPAGTLALDGSVFITNLSSESSINLLNGFTAAQLGSAFVNGSGALRVNLYSSTVTAAAPNGSLTTRFGTPTTANTAFATAAVTKSDRKYLLIQNVTTGSNVITVGIGFTPTTTQGIQLTAGAGITFESSYIPTGQVFVLSSVTASNFTILEA